jgi:hypothetical protein
MTFCLFVCCGCCFAFCCRAMLIGSVGVLRARAFIGLEMRMRALYWLRYALQITPYCTEAFELLTERQMLSSEFCLSCASVPWCR